MSLQLGITEICHLTLFGLTFVYIMIFDTFLQDYFQEKCHSMTYLLIAVADSMM